MHTPCHCPLKALRFPMRTPHSQRVQVGIWYVLRIQRVSHIPTLRPKHIPYTYMDPVGHSDTNAGLGTWRNPLRATHKSSGGYIGGIRGPIKEYIYITAYNWNFSSGVICPKQRLP